MCRLKHSLLIFQFAGHMRKFYMHEETSFQMASIGSHLEIVVHLDIGRKTTSVTVR